jgi:hypothetical protein
MKTINVWSRTKNMFFNLRSWWDRSSICLL